MLNSWNGKESQKRHCNQSNEKLITLASRNGKIRGVNGRNLPRSHRSISIDPNLDLDEMVSGNLKLNFSGGREVEKRTPGARSGAFPSTADTLSTKVRVEEEIRSCV